MAEVEIVAPRRSYAAVSDPGDLWILPELWKTPGRPEVGRGVVLPFPTTPWTGYARPQAPQARLLHLSHDQKTDRMSTMTNAETEGDH